MILIKTMRHDEADKINAIDRSERIESIYRCHNGILEEIKAGHDCPNWDDDQLEQLISRFKHEVGNGGYAVGAYDNDRLVGFGVLGHTFRGRELDQLQIDLMYVSNGYRRRGIGKSIMNKLSIEAKNRGANYLYISSTETESAVHFYKGMGSEITPEVDSELFALEPNDIHMIKKL